MPDRKDLIVIASAKAQPERRQELERALREVAKPTRAQTGCVHFSLYRSVEDPSIIIGFERWASREDHQRYLQGAHVQKLMSAMADALAEPPQISSYEIVDED
jgi:quinol monooxygenase YgiN